ncbi:hypothetical protein Taro_014849, partial [Colocasia esculenta]|nr:hypothetical protein [Colocasia esculenta]
NGEFLDSCIYLGTNSSYSASEDDNVFLEKESEDLSLQTPQQRTIKTDDSKGLVDRPSEVEYVIELQAIGPELTFYSTSRDVGDSLIMSTKLLHAQFDMLVMKADTIDLSGNVLGLKLESNGIRVLEPFDTCVNFSNVSGKTKINASISDIYMNFSFSILKLNEPPSKGVTAVNTNFARVKRPISFKLIWPCLAIEDLQVLQNEVGRNNCPRSTSSDTDKSRKESSCSVWFPVAPQGYVAVGCVVSTGRDEPPLSSALLIWWNQGAQPNKRLSIWRPVVPQGMAYLGDIAVQGYEPPNTCVVLHDTEDEALLKPAINFQLVGYIKKQKGIESISFWLPQAPPGFVSLGCIASKSSPKPIDFSSLRCVRSDLVTGSVFPEESIWNSSDTRTAEWFSIWTVDNEACTFFARKGLKRPPKRFALRLADPRASSGSDDTIIDLEMKTFSAAVYDDYAGLMVPLFNISFSKVGFNIRGGLGYLNSTVSFSLAARSYNDKLDSWEPLIEPIDGFVRYEYDLRAPGAISQLRIATTRDLNLIISVSNMNMIIQAYSSWNSLNNVSNSDADRAIISPTYEGGSVIDAHHRRNYYIIPQNKLGQDIYIRVAENKRFSDIIKMPSGDNKCVTVPVSKNLMDSHFKGKHNKVSRSLVSIIIADAEVLFLASE